MESVQTVIGEREVPLKRVSKRRSRLKCHDFIDPPLIISATANLKRLKLIKLGGTDLRSASRVQKLDGLPTEIEEVLYPLVIISPANELFDRQMSV